MTAPAEDPRGVEAWPRGQVHVPDGWPHHADCPITHAARALANGYNAGAVGCWCALPPPPAAGRGDTDSGGEPRCEAVAKLQFQGVEVADLACLERRWHEPELPHLWGRRTDPELFPVVAAPAARPAGDRVDPAEIVRQRSLGWPDFHPEDYCHTCGRTNPVWFADTAEWQTATDSTGDGGGILCPSCFCALWKQKTGKTAIIWRLSIGGGRDARRALGGTT